MFDLRGQRADMDVSTANVDQIRVLQTAANGFIYFGRGNSKLGSEESCLQTKMRASSDFRDKSEGDTGRFF
jgi:hypothetical protein